MEPILAFLPRFDFLRLEYSLRHQNVSSASRKVNSEKPIAIFLRRGEPPSFLI
jgi:hypothetical protein